MVDLCPSEITVSKRNVVLLKDSFHERKCSSFPIIRDYKMSVIVFFQSDKDEDEIQWDTYTICSTCSIVNIAVVVQSLTIAEWPLMFKRFSWMDSKARHATIDWLCWEMLPCPTRMIKRVYSQAISSGKCGKNRQVKRRLHMRGKGGLRNLWLEEQG